jgi:hypothetical protein
VTQVWFFPSWSGDIRLEKVSSDTTRLTVHAPTPHEVEVLSKLGAALGHEKWPKRWAKKTSVEVEKPLDALGVQLRALLRPSVDTLTAVTFGVGREETHVFSGSEPVEAALQEGEQAVTVARPTPSCPACEVGSVEPANDVLQRFLSPQQHEDWSRTRSIRVKGGSSGVDYLVAHRHSAVAARYGRICLDLTFGEVVHFHDWTVPPEEEVLAAKLVLEHRESWLRNEATLFGAAKHVPFFKNPFGDHLDGRADANVLQALGELFMSNRVLRHG